MTFRFHVLGIQHTASNRRHLSCAYTQKVVKLCSMLKGLGHTVIHYGNEGSDVECDEQVQMCSSDDLAAQYGDRWMTDQYSFDIHDPVYKKFDAIAIGEIAKRKQPQDFLLCMWGHGHRRIADMNQDMIVVEPGIGYAGGHFAPYKIFESYALLHAYLGLKSVGEADMNGHWYDVVIPNYFDPQDFTFTAKKDNYVLFLGRACYGKGIDLLDQLQQVHPFKLIMAGVGKREELPEAIRPSFIGFADYDKRRELLSNARALIAPSLFAEPFAGVQLEAMFSGTPVISTDWGAFSEYNLHGITGYRCRTLDQFIWAVDHVGRIDPMACRKWAMKNFACDRVAKMYDEFFHTVMDMYGKGGWKELHPERTQLDALTKVYPQPGYYHRDDAPLWKDHEGIINVAKDWEGDESGKPHGDVGDRQP